MAKLILMQGGNQVILICWINSLSKLPLISKRVAPKKRAAPKKTTARWWQEEVGNRREGLKCRTRNQANSLTAIFHRWTPSQERLWSTTMCTNLRVTKLKAISPITSSTSQTAISLACLLSPVLMGRIWAKHLRYLGLRAICRSLDKARMFVLRTKKFTHRIHKEGKRLLLAKWELWRTLRLSAKSPITCEIIIRLWFHQRSEASRAQHQSAPKIWFC